MAETENASIELERVRQRYGLYKVLAGSAAVGIISAMLPFIIEQAKISLDTEKSRRDFVVEYVRMLEEKPDSQIALADYFSFVLPSEKQRGLWAAYGKHLAEKSAAENAKSQELERLLKESDGNKTAEVSKLQRELFTLRQQLKPLISTGKQCLSSRAFSRTASEYERLFWSIEVSQRNKKQVKDLADRVLAERARYENVVQDTLVPWFFVGLIHMMESQFNFSGHLINGDPLTSRTVNIPASRPLSGTPPFTWEESAKDLIEYKKYRQLKDWSLSRILYRLEKYNGWGYRHKGVCSPYLWSFSQHYRGGQYVADGVYSPKAISRQIGAAVVLKELVDRGAISLD
ncbi:hypothetical protein [Coralliovum pocilloporae]|uniref:hypothetical protein n=1 Tax=Coralliovum pocilloporae TaxID=3066369 RepID=UPI0033075E12